MKPSNTKLILAAGIIAILSGALNIASASRKNTFENGNIGSGVPRSPEMLAFEAAWTPLNQSGPKEQAREQFNENKYGMFIHWGLYSQLGGIWKGEKMEDGGRGPNISEWIMRKKAIPRDEYATLADTFNPEGFDADEWVAIAKAAGMRYMVITSKHHDGFALFDSGVDDFNSVDGTPFGRDIIRELEEACERGGIAFGVYYSHALDWRDGGDAGMKDYRKEGQRDNTGFLNDFDPSPTSFDAYITTNAPHGPFRAPKEYFEKYINHPLLKDYEIPQNTWAKRTKVEMASFYGMITNIDDNFAALRQLLKDEGIEENTILIFTTDNGSSAGTPIHNAGMRGGKGSKYDGGHRVPWFMSWPAGDLGGGKDIDLLTAHMDILPTLIDLLDLKAPEIAFDGSSLKDVLHGKPQSNLENRTLVLENQRVKDPIKWRGTAVMRGMWRYTLTGEKEELYSLESDPGQRKNIAGQHPEMVQSLVAEYEKFWDDVSQEHHLFSRPEVGSPQSNPVRLTSHDHITEEAILPAWHQEFHIYPGTPRYEAPWSIQFVEDGTYEISIRRWPAEQDWAINYHPEPEEAFSAVRAYLELNDIRMEKEVPAGAKEVTFSVEIEAGPASLNTGFIEENGQRVSAYYAYLLNTEIDGAPKGWQSREGLGLRQIDWAGAPEWKQIESEATEGK